MTWNKRKQKWNRFELFRPPLPNKKKQKQLHFIKYSRVYDCVEFLLFQDALESLKQRAELVITENETLFDQLKTQAITQVLSADKQFDFEVQTVCVYVNWFV